MRISGPARVNLLVAAVVALSVVSIASAATVWAASHHHHKRHRRTARFRLAGNLSGPLGLGAGGAQPLNLRITNHRGKRLIVRDIRVSVSSVIQRPGAHGSCSQTGPDSPNFGVANLPAGYRVKVPPHATRTLARLGRHREPLVTWLDQPWAQNGCIGATINLSFRAKGRYAKVRHRRHRRHR